MTTPKGSFRAKREVVELLRALNYLPAGGMMLSQQELENAIALLSLAAKFDRFFQLPVTQAKGMWFFGGEISHSSFGLNDFPSRPVGIGGCGLTFQQAFASCIGEAGEYLSGVEYPDDELVFYGKPDLGPLCKKTIDWIAQNMGNSDWQPEAHEKWLCLKQLGSNEELHLPAELVLRQPGTCRIAPLLSDSTGCAAGRNLDDAVFSGLMEVVERDAVALWWYGGNRAKTAEKDLLFTTEFAKTATKLRNRSKRKFWLLDVSSDLNIPTIACISSTSDGREAVAGFSAHLDFQIAAQKAFCEMCQMELAQELSVMKLQQDKNNLNAQDHVWLERKENLSVSGCKQLQATGPSRLCRVDQGEAGLGKALEVLREAGFSAYFTDLTRRHIGIAAARVVVPGLQASDPARCSQRLKSVALDNKINPDNLSENITPI